MKGLFIFAAGLAVGAVAGAYLVKDKVMADAKQEIEEVREYYKSKKETKEEEPQMEEKIEETKEVEEKEEYQEITKQYTNYNNVSVAQTPKNFMQPDDEPYVIEPDEFGDRMEEGWDTMTLTYFADGVLINDVDEVIDDPDPVVGLDNLKIFEEFPGATSVYVRNDTWRTDFEILRDDWKWSDLQDPPVEKKPHQL